MSRFTGETPMDFEWGNGTGAIDSRSPFAQVSSNAQRFPASASKKRTYSAFDSPQRPRTMGTQQSSPNKPLPPRPSQNSLFATPRKPRPEIDDSSAGETPKSPDNRNDSDATPDITNARSAMTMFDSATKPAIPSRNEQQGSPTKERPEAERRDSILRKFYLQAKTKFSSPGRGEIPRSEHAGAIEKRRPTKRKRDVDRQVKRRRRHSMSDSGDEAEHHRARSPRKRSGQKPAPEEKPHWITALFTFIGDHPTVPHILSIYIQFLWNVFLMGLCCYAVYCFWTAVQGDVDKKAHEAIADVLADMAVCAADYKDNNCDSPTRALQNLCKEWDKCMSRDATKVGRARVSAHTFAEIFNSFVEPISWKAMAFTLVLVLGSFGVSNFAFGFFRHKLQQPNYGYRYNGPPPPPTPHRAFSGQDGTMYTVTPWHAPQGMGLEPMPSGGFSQIEGQGSPVRRLAYK